MSPTTLTDEEIRTEWRSQANVSDGLSTDDDATDTGDDDATDTGDDDATDTGS